MENFKILNDFLKNNYIHNLGQGKVMQGGTKQCVNLSWGLTKKKKILKLLQHPLNTLMERKIRIKK